MYRGLPAQTCALLPNILLLAGLCTQPAQTWASPSREFEPLVVTATRTLQAQSLAPVRVELVDASELQRMHAQTLADALENVPGLQLREIHGKSGHELLLQGLSGDQVLVLINGQPLATSTGSTVDLDQYALAEVERIEIVKGASSAHYGSAAMGGVVNVITRDVSDGLSLGARLEGGSRPGQNPGGEDAEASASSFQVQVEGGTPALRMRLAADQINDDGFKLHPQDWAQPGDLSRRQQYAAELNWQAAPALSVQLNHNRYQEDDESRYEYYAAPSYIDQRRTEDIERIRSSVDAGYVWEHAGALSVSALDERYSSHSVSHSQAAVVTDRRAHIDQQQWSVQWDAPRWKKQLLSIGIEQRHESLRQQSNGRSELQGAGEVRRRGDDVFVQNHIKLGQHSILAGLRAQNDSDFGDHVAPKLAWRWGRAWHQDGQIHLRASFGGGYRVPNLKERHYLFDHSALGYQVVGNPALQPESSSSWQLGVTAQRPGLELHANVFRNDVEDLIQTDLDNAQVLNGVALYSYANIARARTQGLETSARWRFTPLWSLQLAYTYTDAQDLNAGRSLTRRPRHMARMGLDWDAPLDLQVSLRGRYQSDERVDADSATRSPSWATVDLKLNHALDNRLSVFAGIENLFDRQRDFSSANDFGPLYGRYVYLGLDWRWRVESS